MKMRTQSQMEQNLFAHLLLTAPSRHHKGAGRKSASPLTGQGRNISSVAPKQVLQGRMCRGQGLNSALFIKHGICWFHKGIREKPKCWSLLGYTSPGSQHLDTHRLVSAGNQRLVKTVTATRTQEDITGPMAPCSGSLPQLAFRQGR